MILSRSNLLAVQGTSKDSPILDNLHIAKDGTTVAFDGRALLAISPVTQEMQEKVTLTDTGPHANEQGITVSTESVKEVLKNLPLDKKFNGIREHVDLSPDGVFTIDDGKREKTIRAKVFPRPFINYRTLLRNAKQSPVSVRVVLNGKRLRNLLDMLNKACPDDSGESPIFLEFTQDNDIILRTINPINSQRALGYMTSYKGAEGQWLEEDMWERKLSTDQSSTAIPTSRQSSTMRQETNSSNTQAISAKHYEHENVRLPIKKSAARKLNNEWRQ